MCDTGHIPKKDLLRTNRLSGDWILWCWDVVDDHADSNCSESFETDFRSIPTFSRAVETDWENRSIRKFLGPVSKKTWRTTIVQSYQERWNLMVMGGSHNKSDHGRTPRTELNNNQLSPATLWLKSYQFRVSNSYSIALPVASVWEWAVESIRLGECPSSLTSSLSMFEINIVADPTFRRHWHLLIGWLFCRQNFSV
jgi:hypothetical protein